jgi:hypothetical protein
MELMPCTPGKRNNGVVKEEEAAPGIKDIGIEVALARGF